MNKTLTSKKSFLSQSKDKNYNTQIQTVFEYLQNNIATASMVTDATGVPQKNFTRFKRKLEKQGKLWETVEKPCKNTGCNAWYLTTNPNLIPISPQLNLFENGSK
jgi:hypothetical protein